MCRLVETRGKYEHMCEAMDNNQDKIQNGLLFVTCCTLITGNSARGFLIMAMSCVALLFIPLKLQNMGTLIFFILNEDFPLT